MRTTYDINSLLSRAKTHPPEVLRASASGFSSWVYKLSHDPTRQIIKEPKHDRKSQSSPFTLRDIPIVANYLASVRNDEQLSNGWGLIYADPGNDASENFLASELVVGDEPLRCRPDGVLRHETTGEILIIERKIAGVISEYRGPMPKDSWPNIKAQLWCYSWINEWANAPKITLMAEVWRRNYTTGEPSPLKEKPFWDREDEMWQDYERLFHLYGGHIERCLQN